MREVKVSRPTPVRPLDEVSDHMGQILRHADELLAEWATFGAQVRGQIERETAVVGSAVATAVDAAVTRAVATTAANVDRAVTEAMAERVGSQLHALTAELARLEARAKAASRLVADQRTGDRKILWGIAGGIALANVLLALVLLRKPAAPDVVPQAVPVVEPHRADEATKPPDPPVTDNAGTAAGSDTATQTGSADPVVKAVDAKPTADQPPKEIPSGDSGPRGAHGAPSRKR